MSTAPVKWAQRKNSIYLTIQLSDVKDIELYISEKTLKFNGISQGKKYLLELDFFQPIVPHGSIWNVKPDSVQMRLNKKSRDDEFWPRLLLHKSKEKTNVTIDWNRYMEEDEADGADFDTTSLIGGMSFQTFSSGDTAPSSDLEVSMNKPQFIDNKKMQDVEIYRSGVSENQTNFGSKNSSGKAGMNFLDLEFSPEIQDLTDPTGITIKTQQNTKFEKRGVKLQLLEAVCDVALQMNADVSYWSIGRIGAEVIGNHEIIPNLSNPTWSCRWGVVDANSTLTFRDQCSLIDMLEQNYPVSNSKHPQLNVSYDEVVGLKSTIFVSFAYSNNFIELVEALNLFLSSHSDQFPKDSTYLWFDLFVNDQWHALEKNFEWWATTFKEAVVEIGNTVCVLSPWNKPVLLERAWCLYEISCSNNLFIALSKLQWIDFKNTLLEDNRSIMSSLSKIDLENSSCFISDEKESIFREVREHDGGFSGFNNKVVSLLRNWVDMTVLEILGEIVNTEDNVLKIDLLQKVEKIAEFYHERRQLDIALHLHVLIAKCFDETHIKHLEADLHIAGILALNMDLIGARDLLAKVKIGMERHYGFLHSETLKVYNNLADVLLKLGDTEGAKRLYKTTLDGYNQTVGPNHLDTLRTEFNLSNLFYFEGNYKEARILCERVYSVRCASENLGPNHPDTLNALTKLCDILQSLGEIELAKKQIEKAIKGFEKTLGPDSNKTLVSILTLANILFGEGNLREAKDKYTIAMKGFEMNFGPNYPDRLGCMTNIGNVLMKEGNYFEAKNYFIAALKGYTTLYGKNHRDLLLPSFGLVNAHLYLLEFHAAEEICINSLRILSGLDQSIPNTRMMFNKFNSLLNGIRMTAS
eukprot:gene14216-19075_t